jgi:regulatory protein
MPVPALSLKGRALRLLGGREHSRAELQRKLIGHEDVPGTLDQVLDDLQAKGFISEQRVIDSVLYRRAAKLGAVRIKQELKAKGLDEEAIKKAVSELEASELERARSVWAKKFGSAPKDARERGKQQRFLSARGFGSDSIVRVLGQGSEEEAL